MARFTRRTLLRGLIATFGLQPPSTVDALGGSAQDTARPPAPPLSPLELDDLLAFAEVLVEGRALAPAERRHLADHIAARLTQDARSYVALYRATVQLVNRLAGVPFASLDVPQRVELIRRHRLATRDVRPGEPPVPSPEDVRVVRARVVPDLIASYYASPMGWSVVGYTVFPGQCGDLTRYTSPEP